MIYLDYAANFPASPAVLDFARQEELAFPGNANANHPAGWAARDELARLTGRIASVLGCEPGEVIYTSGATESNNLALKGLAEAEQYRARHIITTPLEHASVSDTLAVLADQGYEVSTLRLEADGRVSLDHLKSLLRDDTTLVTVSLVDSELGTIQPVDQIAAILRDYPYCRLHVDATQAIGRVPVRLSGVDTLSLSAHKFGGPIGCGLLVKRANVQLTQQIHGGAGFSPYRSGTPAVGLAAACALSLEQAEGQREAHAARVRELRERLEAALREYSAVSINSPAGGVPHILNLSVAGVKGTRFQKELAARGVCVSVKSACSSDGELSRAVFALTGDRRRSLESWRISLSHLTTDADIGEFMQVFDECYVQLVR